MGWSPEWMESLPWGFGGAFTACSATLMYNGYNLTGDLESDAIKNMVNAAGPGARLVADASYTEQVDYHLAHPDTSNWIPQVFIGCSDSSSCFVARSIACCIDCWLACF